MVKMKKRLAQTGAAVTAFAVLASPLAASAATNSASTTVNATVGSTITIATTGNVALGLTPTGTPATSVGLVTATVNTNNTAGYNLRIANNDTTTALVSGGNNIAAHSGSFATPSQLTNNTWGFALAGAPFSTSYTTGDNGGEGSKLFAGVPSSAAPQQIKSTSTVATNDPTEVYVGVKVSNTQPTGTYTDTITFTATTN